MDDTARPRRGRPRQPAEAGMGAAFRFRLTPADRSAIEANAARAGLSPSEFIRRAALGQRVRARRAAATDQLLVELNRIGVNLNQMTARMHLTGEIGGSVSLTLAELRGLMAKVAADDA